MHALLCTYIIFSLFLLIGSFFNFFFLLWFVEEKKREKKKKKVHFAEDVVDPSGDGEEYRRQHGIITNSSSSSSSLTSPPPKFEKYRSQTRGMPANRVALYNGILRDRVVHRLTYSYWSNFWVKSVFIVSNVGFFTSSFLFLF